MTKPSKGMMTKAPTIRAPCWVAWFSAMAFIRWSLGTKLGIKAVAMVIWLARRVPLAKARNVSTQGPASPVHGQHGQQNIVAHIQCEYPPQ